MGDLQEHEENCEIKTYGDVNMEVVIEAIMEINSKAQLQHFISSHACKAEVLTRFQHKT